MLKLRSRHLGSTWPSTVVGTRNANIRMHTVSLVFLTSCMGSESALPELNKGHLLFVLQFCQRLPCQALKYGLECTEGEENCIYL